MEMREIYHTFEEKHMPDGSRMFYHIEWVCGPGDDQAKDSIVEIDVWLIEPDDSFHFIETIDAVKVLVEMENAGKLRAPIGDYLGLT